MTRPLAYITASWGDDNLENATLAGILAVSKLD